MSLPKSKPESKQQFQFTEETIEIRRSPTKIEKQIQLTYWSNESPPRTIWIPAENYDDKKRAEAIKADQEKQKAVKQGTIEV